MSSKLSRIRKVALKLSNEYGSIDLDGTFVEIINIIRRTMVLVSCIDI